ncbi:sulfatase-like hydrolase/transferase [Aquimarina brevivitae]|uniref:Phosphoglycerol transferase MdoB-like AlkP superfamily enzyme n=1 Tax=Aquimarina brevivitae TaxID=323412 RepID=A0A4V2F4U6_9FLAO|nr:sulfatase-like hydrolase/transferase [Aquimarina brevivitae]RZS90549.1 phosphoglycerol transferase MdoB-like AlkP superfamily enzyme [Aquimarina brevivitae]
MKFTLDSKSIYQYVCGIFSLTVVFCIISSFEVLMSKATTNATLATLLYKFTNDVVASVLIGILLFPIYFIANAFIKKYAFTVIKVILLIVVCIQFALVKYSLTTLINLGADLLGYSMDDIYSTVAASETFSLLYFLPFIAFPALWLVTYFLTKKYAGGKLLTGLNFVLIVLFGSLKLTIGEVSEDSYQNKLVFLANDILKFKSERWQHNNYAQYKDEYPFLRKYDKKKDVLSPFFELKTEKPNIVMLIVEGLGTEFTGNHTHGGFTPYLDSLKNKSLYWENFVSNTGRTFGVLPSLLGSLPYGEVGFLEVPKIPSHISLLSVLKANGYTTSYYAGDKTSFDKKIRFLEYHNVDRIIDEERFGPGYTKTANNTEGFSWGYPDAEIFRKTLASLDTGSKPRLDIIMTLSNHEPFAFPQKEQFEQKVDSLVSAQSNFKFSEEDLRNYKDIYTTLYYTDSSIQDFMKAYQKRPDFENTIFVITGDHRLIPVAQKDKLCRFHVPLYIYSPMLKAPQMFKSVSSHWDVTPSLLSMLMNNYQFSALNQVAWMGKGLDTARNFRNVHNIPLMRYKGSVNDYLYQDFLYSDGELYKIKKDFGTYKIKDEAIASTISELLKDFKQKNAYVTQKDRVYPDSLNFYAEPSIDFLEQQWTEIHSLTEGLTFDQAFVIAQKKAFNKEVKEARLLCDYILNTLPNHYDARALKARMLAWDGDYEKAETELVNLVKRAPFYDDGYLALLDVYWWSAQEQKSEAVYRTALKNNRVNPKIGFKMAKAYSRLKDTLRTTILMDSLLKKEPENMEYQSFKNTLR